LVSLFLLPAFYSEPFLILMITLDMISLRLNYHFHIIPVIYIDCQGLHLMTLLARLLFSFSSSFFKLYFRLPFTVRIPFKQSWIITNQIREIGELELVIQFSVLLFTICNSFSCNRN
jgi:hypothetical protein